MNHDSDAYCKKYNVNYGFLKTFLGFLDGTVLLSAGDMAEILKSVNHMKKGAISGIADALTDKHVLKREYLLDVGSQYIVCDKKTVDSLKKGTCKITRNDTKQVYQISPDDIKSIQTIYKVAQQRQKPQHKSLTDMMNDYLSRH